MSTKLPVALPAGMLASDLKYPSYDSGERLIDDYENSRFEMYCVLFSGQREPEWVITTLLIGGRRSSAARAYAVRVSNGKLCRVGGGPHVKATVTVYVRKSRAKALQRFIDLRVKGATEAGQVRDRISSRRAQGQLMRAEGRRHWYWND